MVADVGLTPETAFDVRYAFEYPDAETLARRLLAPGLIVEALRRQSEDDVRRAIVDGLADYRRPDGSYSLENEWHFLIARA